ncbi:MAG: autotransporter-associated beta strand repeat-containing protein, partial [Verrucomicrobiota bacterium]
NFRVEPATINALVENGNAVQAPGGLIILSASAANSLHGSVVNNSGTLVASSLTEQGGKIRLEGDHITLASSARLEASGATGGGEVLVGGGWQGSGGVYQATTVTMEQGASIDVSATKVGAGGTAVLWSDVHNPASVTRAAGTLLAKGGVNGGDGGRIETSGHVVDTVGGFVSAGAPAGRGGLWLIDPADATINQAVADGYVSTLNTGTSVMNAVAGDITLDTSVHIAKSLGGDATLTFKATGSVTLNSGATISSTVGKLNTVLWADSDGNSDGSIWLKGSNTITTNGGHLWMGGGATNTSWNGLTVGGDGTTSGYAVGNGTNSTGIVIGGIAAISTAGGNIALYGKGRNGAVVNLGNGEINADGVWFYGNNINVNSGTGTIYIEGIAQLTTGGWYSVTGVVFFQDNHTITSAAPAGMDAITIRGTGAPGGAQYTQGVYLHPNENLSATGGGNIVITGIGGGGVQKQGIFFEAPTGGNVAAGANAGSGNLTLIADTMDLSGSFSGTGSLTVKPYTASTSIGIAGGTGTLQLPSSYFSTNFVNGFSGITVGRSDGTGALSVNGLTFNDPLVLQNASGGINLAGTITDAGTGTSSGSISALAGTGAISGSGTLTSRGASTTFNQGADGTYSGVIGGTANLIKDGTGALTLSGTNTYTGATTISAGTLKVGNATTTGTLGSGAVINK